MLLNSNSFKGKYSSPIGESREFRKFGEFWRKKNKIALALVFLLIIFGVMSRFLPHAWNFTPITALALFISAYFGARYFLVAVPAILFISDLFIGFYQWQIMIAVYGSFMLAGMVGCLIKSKKSAGLIFVSAIGSSLVFFLVTNWAVWQFGAMYEHSFAGLIQSYIMALPFFRNSLVGDLFYAGVFFGGFEVVRYLALSLKSRARHSALSFWI